MLEFLILDRFEGPFAVCEREDRSMVNLPRAALPDTVREGDVLRFDGKRYTVDAAETAKRKARLREKRRGGG